MTLRIAPDPRSMREVFDVQPTTGGKATVVLSCGHYVRDVSDQTRLQSRERCPACAKALRRERASRDDRT